MRKFKMKTLRVRFSRAIRSSEEASETSGQSEEEELGHALSQQGTLRKNLDAFIKMRVDVAVEKRMTTIQERLRKIFPKTVCGNSEVSTSASSTEDAIMAPMPAPTPAPTPASALLNKFTDINEVCPPKASAGSPSWSQSAGKVRAAKPLLLFPKLVPLPPYHPRILPDITLPSLSSIGSVSSHYTLVSSGDKTELLKKDRLPKSRLPRLNRAPQQPCSLPPQARVIPVRSEFKNSRLPSPLSAQDMLERRRAQSLAKASNAHVQNDQFNRQPSMAKTKSILDKSQSENSNVPPPPTGVHQESGRLAQKRTKRGFFGLRRAFTSKVAPCPTPKNSDEQSLETPAKFFPFAKPQVALEESFKLISSEDWEKRIEGLNSIRRLAQCHANILTPKLHDVCVVVVKEVQNLRSLVSRAAMATLGDLYLYLRCAMDSELDWTAKALLHKAGECNNFIRQDVGVALGHMLRSCTPSQSMKALLNGGLSHRNVAIRECNTRHLETLVDMMGTTHLLRCKKELLNSFLSAVSRLPQDASQEVRSCGRNILSVLSADKDINKKLKNFHK